MADVSTQNPDHVAEDSKHEAANAEPQTKSSSGITRRQMKVLVSLIYNHFWGAACYSIQAPFFPKEAEMKGASSTEYSLVFSIFELVVILASPIFGKMIPSVTPKFLMVAGSFLIGGACTLFGVLDRIDSGRVFIAMAFLTRTVEGLGAAAYVTGSFTIIASEFPDSVGRAFSLVETAFGFGLIAGPTIGGALYQGGGFILPFVTNGCLLLMGALLFFILMPEIEDTGVRKSPKFKKFLMDPGILTHLFALITTFVLIGFNAGTLEPHLRQFNIKPAILGVIFVITGGVYALTTPVWGWVADKGASSYLIMAAGYFVTALGIIFIGPLPFIPFHATTWTVIASLIVMGVGMAPKLVAAFTGTVQIVPTLGFPDNLATHGMISGLFSFACSLGAFIGPSLGGLLLDHIGYEAGTYVILAEELLFLSLLVAFVAWKRQNSSEDEERAPILSDRSTENSPSVNNIES